MSILLDRKSLQVASHCGDFHPSVLGKRLEIFLGILEGIDGEIPDQDNSLLYEVIFKHDLLVIPTRIDGFVIDTVGGIVSIGSDSLLTVIEI